MYKVTVKSLHGPLLGGIPLGRYELDWERTDDDDSPKVHIAFDVINGNPQCRAVHVDSRQEGREVRRTDLQIALEDHLEWVTQIALQMLQNSPPGTMRAAQRLLRRRDQPSSESTGPGDLDDGDIMEFNLPSEPFLRNIRDARKTARRRGPSDDELSEAVEVYRSAERAPTQAVADHFEIAHRTASLWIKRARDKGYLPRAESGKASR